MTPIGKKIPTILLLFFSILSFGGCAEIEEYRKIDMCGYYRPITKFAFRGDGSFVFATRKESRRVRELECVIHVVGLSGPEITYPFSYKTIEDGDFLNLAISFDTLNNVAYVELDEPDSQHRYFMTILAINLTSGAVSKLDLPAISRFEHQRMDTIIDYKGLNLILRDPSVCGDHMPRCKLTFNGRGERLGGPVSFPIEDGYLENFPRVVKSEDEGALVIQYPTERSKERRYKSVYIDATGNTTILHRFTHSPGMFSDSDDLYLACAYTNSSLEEVDCAQYDWKLNETIALKFPVKDLNDEGNVLYVESVASMAKSKILVAYFECRGSYLTGCKYAFVSSIKSDGKVLKTTRLFDDLDTNFLKDVQIPAIVEVGNEFCFYMSYHVFSDLYLRNCESPLYVQTQCISKSDL